MTSTSPSPFTGYQKFVVAVLSFLQFTIILDFMIMSPLGAMMMPALNMTPGQFGMVVSAYAFSAGGSGLLAAGFADRFDRKKLLMFFYVGFMAGTICCALAPSFEFMMGARIVTGLFGGVIGSIVFAIITDLFPLEKRGRVMGFIQTSFAASQIMGIPAGLYISNLWGWHAPFVMIVAVSAVVGVFIVIYLRPIDGHLKLQIDRNPFHHLYITLTTPKYLLAFGTTALLSIGGYLLMPFGSNFTVHNMKIDIERLPLIYLVTGFAAIFIGPLVGKASDALGKYRVFVAGSLLSMMTVLYYTTMGPSPLYLVMTVNVVMFVAIFSRMIPSQTLMSAIPEAANRGSFMSISSSLQQIAGGIASVVAGAIVVQGKDGVLEHFDTLGYIMVGTASLSIFMMFFINRMVARRTN
jgi:predicted MFS family arabinose efflux permease